MRFGNEAQTPFCTSPESDLLRSSLRRIRPPRPFQPPEPIRERFPSRLGNEPNTWLNFRESQWLPDTVPEPCAWAWPNAPQRHAPRSCRPQPLRGLQSRQSKWGGPEAGNPTSAPRTRKTYLGPCAVWSVPLEN